MSATISIAALVLVLGSTGAAPTQQAPSLTLPPAVTAQAAREKEKDSIFDAIPWRRSPQSFATWGGPSGSSRPGDHYDERYITW